MNCGFGDTIGMPAGRNGYRPSDVTSPSDATSGTAGTTGTRPITSADGGAGIAGSAVVVAANPHGAVALARMPSYCTSPLGPPSVRISAGQGSASPSRSARIGFFVGAVKLAGVMSAIVIAGYGWSSCGALRWTAS